MGKNKIIEQHRCHYSDDDIIIQTIYKDRKATFIKHSVDGIDEIEYHELIDNEILVPAHKVYLENGSVIVPSGISLDDIDGIENDVYSYLKRFLFIEEDELLLLTAYILYTWLYDRVSTAPYLWILGEYGTAKSRIGELIGLLSFSTTFLGTAVTPANIFRMQNEIRGTLIMDEMDMDFSDRKSPFVQILNGGYKSNGVVYRSESHKGQQFVPIPYSSFGAKAVISREEPKDDSLKSRSFLIRTPKIDKHTLNKNGIPLNINAESRIEAEQLRNRLLGYRFKYFRKVPYSVNMSFSDSISPRAEELITSMLSVLPISLHLSLVKVLETHLFESGATQFVNEEMYVKNAISELIKGKTELPIKILVKDIVFQIKNQFHEVYESKEIVAIAERMNLEISHLAKGTIVIMRKIPKDEGNVGNEAK